MADSINLMLDEMVDDIKWLIELGFRRVDEDFAQDIEELVRLDKKYFGKNYDI